MTTSLQFALSAHSYEPVGLGRLHGLVGRMPSRDSGRRRRHQERNRVRGLTAADVRRQPFRDGLRNRAESDDSEDCYRERGTKPRCDERLATIVGTAGDDVLVGTKHRDVIAGLGGNDVKNGAHEAWVSYLRTEHKYEAW